MSDDDAKVGCGPVMVLCACCLIVGILIGRLITAYDWELYCVEHGVAEWAVNDDGWAYWKWKPEFEKGKTK